MKYLQIYEAFESNVITKAIKFLKSKKINVDKFKNSLLEFQSVFDYPLSNIEDNDVKYLNYKRAIYLKNEEKVDNKWGIYCIKYWFSLESGYLGTTITGNTRYRYNSDNNNSAFTPAQFNFIKNELGIEKGELTPVEDYLSLRTGDKVIIELIMDEEDEDKGVTNGIIYRLGDNRIFVIQDLYEGATPNGHGGNSEWEQYGSNSWIIYSDSINDDHAHLHLYKSSSDDLHYSYESIDEKDDYLEYNLPSYNFTPQRWYKTFINDADFAIVIMLDDMLKEKKVKSAISQERSLRRKGATKLMTDYDIRKSNITKYRNAEVYKMVNRNTTEFSNLQKIVIKNFCGKYILFSVLCNHPSTQNMTSFLIRKLNNIKNSKNDIDEHITQLANFYEDVKSNDNYYTERFKDSLFYVHSFKNDNLNFIIDKIMEMSDKIYNYLQAQNIKTIDDLNKLLDKITDVNDYFFSKSNLDSTILYCLNNFYSPGGITRELVEYHTSPMQNKKNIESIKKIEKIINSDFKI